MAGLLDMLAQMSPQQAPEADITRPIMQQQAQASNAYDPETHGPPTSQITETWQGRMPGSRLPPGASAAQIQAEWDAAGQPQHPLPGARYEEVAPAGENTPPWDFITGEIGDKHLKRWGPKTKLWRRVGERPMS